MIEEDNTFGGLTVVTSLRYSYDKLKKLNNISYLFNPSWDASGRIRVGANTLPMSLLYITSYREQAQSEISSEQLILYRGDEAVNNEDDKNRSTMPQAVLNVVADNIVNKPRQWQIEAVLPATYDALINSPFNLGTGFLTNPTMEYLQSGGGGNISTALTVVPNIVAAGIGDIVSIMSSLIPLLDGQKWTNGEDLLSLVENESSYNKDSLIDMWMSRAILKFKPPMEWNYKTVVITNIDCAKKPTEDNCYRVSLTLQEVPIMTTGFYTGILAGLKDESRTKGASLSAKWVGDTLKKVLNKVGNERGV